MDIFRRASIDDKFRAMNTSLVFGERVGCTIENSWKLVGCVRRGREGKDALAFLLGSCWYKRTLLLPLSQITSLAEMKLSPTVTNGPNIAVSARFQIRSLFSFLENASHFAEDIVGRALNLKAAPVTIYHLQEKEKRKTQKQEDVHVPNKCPKVPQLGHVG